MWAILLSDKTSVSEMRRSIRGISHALVHYNRKSKRVHDEISPDNMNSMQPAA